MKHIYLNLKRFDVPTEYGGVNRIAPVADWAEFIVKNTQEELKKYDPAQVEFGMYFPEIHLLNAVKARSEGSPIKVGCQSVYRADTAVGGNFGAFTTNVRLPPWWQQAVRLPSLDTVRREMIRWVSWLRLALLIPTQ